MTDQNSLFEQFQIMTDAEMLASMPSEYLRWASKIAEFVSVAASYGNVVNAKYIKNNRAVKYIYTKPNNPRAVQLEAAWETNYRVVKLAAAPADKTVVMVAVIPKNRSETMHFISLDLAKTEYLYLLAGVLVASGVDPAPK